MSLPGSHGVPRIPALVWRNALRFHAQHRWQTLLSLLGIVLGVMMVVAVDLASTSARRAFALSVQSVSGTLTHQIVGGSQGVPEQLYTRLRTELGLRRSAPVVTGEVRLSDSRLTLLGLDLVSEGSLQRELPGLRQDALTLTRLAAAALTQGNAVILPETLAQRLGLPVGAEFRLAAPHAAIALQLVGVLPAAEGSAGDVLFADIATAQRLLDRSGRLDSIDLILDAAQAAVLRNWLPPGLSLVEADGRNASLEQMTEAFHINLLAMSLLALLVAALLIYNTVSLSVLERRHGFGVLRSLGLTRAELARLILLETAALGVFASALGVLAGVWLGSFLVELVTRTIDDLYFTLTVREFLIDPLLLLKGFGWGLGMTLLAAALPAWQAGRSPPVTLQQKGQDGAALQRRLPWYSGVALLLLAVGYGVLHSGGGLVRGFVALFLLVFGFCLLVPQLLHWLLRCLLCLPSVQHRFGLRLALRAIESGLDRTALAVAALTVAVSVTVGVGLMVASLRDSVLLWLDQSLPGDVQLTWLAPGGGFDAGLQQVVAGQSGVAGLRQGWQLEAESSVGHLRLQAAEGAADDWLYLKQGAPGGLDEILIAEPAAAFLQLTPGDALTLDTAAGRKTLRISGVFYDYSTGNPLLALSQAQLEAFWPGLLPTRLTLYLDDVASASLAQEQALLDTLRHDFTRRGLNVLVTPNRSIYAGTLFIFDRAFAITQVLRLLAVVVAFVGVFSAMLALQLQRLHDYAVLRASGMTSAEVALLILRQTLVMGLLAGLLALPLGLLMSDVLIDVINLRSFGWSMQHSIPGRVLLEAVVLATLAAVLAGIMPARRVARVQAAEALQGE